VIEEEAKEEEYAGDGRSSHKKQQVQVNLRFRQPEAPTPPLISEFISDKKFIFPSIEEDQRRDQMLDVGDEVTEGNV
jgi:hypothetical protein